jgi:hypothetical protein
MLNNRNRPEARTKVEVCPHCGHGSAGALVHIEGPVFLCYRCLREIHTEPQHHGRRQLSVPGGHRRAGRRAAGR